MDKKNSEKMLSCSVDDARNRREKKKIKSHWDFLKFLKEIKNNLCWKKEKNIERGMVYSPSK